MLIKLDHVNLTVSDLEQSIYWYSKIFGFSEVEKGVGTKGQHWSIVASNDSMIVMTEQKDLKPADTKNTEGKHRIYHFGIRVSDEKAWEDRIKTFQLELNYGGAIEYPYSRSYYVNDPSGHEIEVSVSQQEKLQFPNQTQK
jgi:catechol 2,3-dioxygenase-like lactoylglutathione lyase family enzyme